MVGVNVGRSVGPALAGLVIAVAGVPAVFALNAVSVLLFAAVLLRWPRPPAGAETRRERFVPALRAGGRYVWFEPVGRRMLLRVVLFIGTVLLVGRIRGRVSSNRLLAAAGIAYAVALPSLVLAGLAWTSVISTLNAELQLFLPVWVRARGLAGYLVVFAGALAFGSLIWGRWRAWPAYA